MYSAKSGKGRSNPCFIHSRCHTAVTLLCRKKQQTFTACAPAFRCGYRDRAGVFKNKIWSRQDCKRSESNNTRAEVIHGGKSQNERQRALNNFKNKRTRVLVATDIAARGIDIDDLTHVINFDFLIYRKLMCIVLVVQAMRGQWCRHLILRLC